MKLSDWARQEGIDYKTAYRWFRAGSLPIPSTQISTGTILVHPPEAKSNEAILYARVSSFDQAADLDRQIARLVEFATSRNLQIVRCVKETGSGLNGHRSKLLRVLSDPAIPTIVVEHRERLARFGVEYIEAALAAHGRQLVVADETELKDDLVRDMTDVLTSLCARLYGRRSARNRAKRAVTVIQQNKGAV